MMKTKIFKALAIGFLSHTLFSGPADAADSACPVFTSAMIDATAMVAGLLDVQEPVAIRDESKPTDLFCVFFTNSGDGAFLISVGLGEARVFGATDEATYRDDESIAESNSLTPQQEQDCRKQVLQSFVWNQFCAPFLP